MPPRERKKLADPRSRQAQKIAFGLRGTLPDFAKGEPWKPDLTKEWTLPKAEPYSPNPDFDIQKEGYPLSPMNRLGIEQIPSGNYLQQLFRDLRNQAFGPKGPLMASPLHPDEHIYELYKDYMGPMNPGPKPFIDFEEWKRDIYPGMDQGIDSTGLSQDWKKIYEKTGNEDLANEWVASQQTADASDWIDFGVNTGRNVYDMYQESQFGLDPFEGSIGYDKQFDLPFGGTGNIEADYDLEDQKRRFGIKGNWKWGA